MSEAQFGMIGLGTMGRNFILNVAEQGFSCVGYDLDERKRQLLIDEGSSFAVTAASDVKSFVASLGQPRKVMLLVPAGPIVDSVINELVPLLSEGDIMIDGGNSHFLDTERREELLARSKIAFLGVGVSGGEEGARHGASIMAGGHPEFYEHVRPIFEAASAKVNGEPCAAHVGHGSAGHFVKMVHNGIEYGLMQLIAEAYDLMKRGFGMNTREIADIFGEWNAGELNSFLIEITATVLRTVDQATGEPLVDLILDTAGQKGTGKWTSQVAMDLGVPIPTIDSAVTMRQISARKIERVAAEKTLEASASEAGFGVDVQTAGDPFDLSLLRSIHDGLSLAFLITYAQGMSLLRTASEEKNFSLDYVEIAKIWRGGCIIRAALLEDIRRAFESHPDLANILFSDVFVSEVQKKTPALASFINLASSHRIPSMSAAASMNYLTAMTTGRLPANLIQAQRDFFGAHTYLRLDKEGVFHTPDW
jgi:6-phosphogluconate dehydrogenase